MRGRRSGSAFSRFKDKDRSLIARQKSPAAPTKNLTVITTHVEKYFGDDSFFLHEEKSALIHVDVIVVPPSRARPFYTLLTSGMSDRAMQVPRGVTNSNLAEVCLCLPKEWPLSQKSTEWKTPEFFWPIAVVKRIARYPHLHQTWLSQGHTIGSIE